MNEKERIRKIRIASEKFWKSKAGEEQKKCNSEWMKVHGGELFRMRKDQRGKYAKPK